MASLHSTLVGYLNPQFSGLQETADAPLMKYFIKRRLFTLSDTCYLY